AARRMLPDNPLVLQRSILVRVNAAGIYQQANLPDKRAAVLRDAKREVRELEPFIENTPTAFPAAWYYYEEIRDRDMGLKVARRALERSGSPLAAVYCVIELSLQVRFEEALQCLEQPRQTTPLAAMMRAIVLAEIGLDGRRRALQEIEQVPVILGAEGNA